MPLAANPFSTSRHDAAKVALLGKDDVKSWSRSQPTAARHWLKGRRFSGATRQICAIPGPEGRVGSLLIGLGADALEYRLHSLLWSSAAAAAQAPAGLYKAPDQLSPAELEIMALGWALGFYRFDAYKSPAGEKRQWPKLNFGGKSAQTRVLRIAEAIAWTRDLINRPANDMSPAALAEEAEDLAGKHRASYRLVAGKALETGYPAIHAVGHGAGKGRNRQAPRLIDLSWGAKSAPRLTLIGKGVCFDTGGLNLKPDNSMRLMKKDMGGAAHALGLARLIMEFGLKLRLRVLIPAVENAVSAAAMRPLDVLKTRSGQTVEVGHTDAEGRIILADALTEAGEEKPEAVIDFATLTGAARAALGSDIPALFSNDECLAGDLLTASNRTGDPLWRLPLWRPYAGKLTGRTADLNNAGGAPYGGAIMAALFLQRFIGDDIPWAHLDLMAWNVSSTPGRPEGGEAMGLRAVFATLEQRYPAA